MRQVIEHNQGIYVPLMSIFDEGVCNVLIFQRYRKYKKEKCVKPLDETELHRECPFYRCDLVFCVLSKLSNLISDGLAGGVWLPGANAKSD